MKKDSITVCFIFIMTFMFSNGYAESNEKYYSDTRENKTYRILTNNDIQSLKQGVIGAELIDKFGNFIGSTLPVLTWPKYSEKIDFKNDSLEKVWRNGYWFIFERNVNPRTSPLLYVISLDVIIESTDLPQIALFEEMTVNWPNKYKGMTLAELYELKGNKLF